MKAVDEAFAWAKTQNQTLKQVLREDRKMKAEDVKVEWVEITAAFVAKAAGCADENCSTCRNYARNLLAAVIPLIQKEEREACVKVADLYEPKLVVSDGGGKEDESVYSAIGHIIEAIRTGATP